jgi:site-specific recombinase XerD
MSPSEFVEVVVASLKQEGNLTEGTLTDFPPKMRMFASFCERALGVTEVTAIGAAHAKEFVFSAKANGATPTVAWMHVRRGAVRLLFKQGRRLGLVTIDPTLDLELPSRSMLTTRPLTDDELDLCRLSSLESFNDLRRPTCWALGEATARTSEMYRVRICDIDVEGKTVFLLGDARTVARRVALTDWGLTQVRRAIRAAGRHPKPETVLVPTLESSSNPRAAVSMAVIRTLRAAGIHSESDVRPRSVVAWRGAHELTGGASIDEVALLLGCRSLDQTADIVGFDWRASEVAVEG